MNYKILLGLALLIAAVTGLAVVTKTPSEVGASVRVGDQYRSTTTPQVADLFNLCPALPTGMASTTSGILGTINVFNANTGGFIIYDATTSNRGLSQDKATTSLILAEIPPSPTETSYNLDVEFKRGLLIDYTTTAAVAGSSSISYRCEL